jgi:hypothetical protein
MNTIRTLACALLVTGASALALPAAESSSSSSGYVDEEAFRALIDDTKDVVEVDLDGAILQALANKKDDESGHAHDLFAKLKSIHAVIGTVKGPASAARELVQRTDRKLVSAGWQRIARITDETSTVTVLTHTVGGKIDGLVALIFDTGDNELVFANLAGEIDITKLGEIGEQLNVPGLDQVPGSH